MYVYFCARCFTTNTPKICPMRNTCIALALPASFFLGRTFACSLVSFRLTKHCDKYHASPGSSAIHTATHQGLGAAVIAPSPSSSYSAIPASTRRHLVTTPSGSRATLATHAPVIHIQTHIPKSAP